MPVQTSLIIVEGPHDTEFIARLLKPAGFHRIQSWRALPEYWKAIVPQKFPAGDDLLARHPTPTFFGTSDGRTTAIRTANGITRITTSLSDTLSQLAGAPDAIAVILDADQTLVPGDRQGKFLETWKSQANHTLVHFADSAGDVFAGPPKAGVFILPDNTHPGTLEDLLIQGAEENYPNSLAAAKAYVASLPKPDLRPDDLRDFSAPAGPKKAVVAALACILKPGKAIQVSIQDNRWLDEGALRLPDIARVSKFLSDLLA